MESFIRECSELEDNKGGGLRFLVSQDKKVYHLEVVYK